MAQVSKEYYNFKNYCGQQRWNSYYEQLSRCYDWIKDGCKILIIGQGDGVVGLCLKHICKRESVSATIDIMDFDSQLNPDIVGDVSEIENIVNTTYDIILVCEVLEHLPFDKFDDIMRQLNGILNFEGHIIMSLPYQGRGFEVSIFYHDPMPHGLSKLILHIPKFYRPVTAFKNNEHFWELGLKETSISNVKKIILRNGFSIQKIAHERLCMYHVFFNLKKEND